jgi:hypothetical protein
MLSDVYQHFLRTEPLTTKDAERYVRGVQRG